MATGKWDPVLGRRRIMMHAMDDTLTEHNHNTRDVLNMTMNVVGAFAETEVLGLFSVTSEHTRHVDHGWIIRYVLKVNGIKLAEKWVRSDRHGASGPPLADGAAHIAPCKLRIHKAAYKEGITDVPTITGP